MKTQKKIEPINVYAKDESAEYTHLVISRKVNELVDAYNDSVEEEQKISCPDCPHEEKPRHYCATCLTECAEICLREGERKSEESGTPEDATFCVKCEKNEAIVGLFCDKCRDCNSAKSL